MFIIILFAFIHFPSLLVDGSYNNKFDVYEDHPIVLIDLPQQKDITISLSITILNGILRLIYFSYPRIDKSVGIIQSIEIEENPLVDFKIKKTDHVELTISNLNSTGFAKGTYEINTQFNLEGWLFHNLIFTILIGMLVLIITIILFKEIGR